MCKSEHILVFFLSYFPIPCTFILFSSRLENPSIVHLFIVQNTIDVSYCHTHTYRMQEYYTQNLVVKQVLKQSLFLPLGRWKGTLCQEDLPVKYIVISEHLDMVGVKLKASYLQTRKINCDDLQEKVNNVIKPWKGGKFMPLTQRSHSLNTYCLSKVWFKCPSVNLRACDHTKITANIRSWLFQDQLEKPEDFVLYRPRNLGGLGLVHVEIKAQALLTRSFLETAVNPSFRRNLYHEALYRWHVLNDRKILNPGLTPYYDESFFMRIKEVKEEGLLNVTTMSCSSWYRVLLENYVTHRVNENGVRELRPCKVESRNPDKKWEHLVFFYHPWPSI